MPYLPPKTYKYKTSETLHSPISDTGLSIVYTPRGGPPLLDIVIVHGLQGHPFNTWACTKIPKGAPSPSQPSSDVSHDAKKAHSNFSLRRIYSKASTKSSVKSMSTESSYVMPSVGNTSDHPITVFWPADLAPNECPRSRIFVYGYDTKVSKYMTGPTNKNHVLSHGKDLLYALGRERTYDRPLVFIAHSLGGIIVKETLAASSASMDDDLKNVVDSTAAVIFMGTPHRGSPDLSALGEWARTVLSIFRMETTSTILDTLGLKTNDLERAQESFSGLWSKYDFRVKTFQESLGLTGVHLGVLGNKVVPDYSSLLGDSRERAESIQANHMDMCRFSGANDPNYRKVAGELRSIYRLIQNANDRQIHQDGLIQREPIPLQPGHSVLGDGERNEDKSRDAAKGFLQKLKFPTMKQRYLSVSRPAEDTCSWLFQHEKYQDWLKGRNPDPYEGLLLLQGRPGAGKSILMKEAHRRVLFDQAESDYISARFFFHAQGQELEHSITGMFRSLLHQILPKCQEDLERFGRLWNDGEVPLLRDLQEFFESLYSKARTRRTFIFIDALDECDHQDVITIACFWRHITRKAHACGAQLNVIMSTRDFPHIALSNCSEIRVDHCNQHDIARYIEQRASLVTISERDLTSLKRRLVAQSKGVFLWAMLMLEKMIEIWHEGKRLSTVLSYPAGFPMELDALYTAILAPVEADMKQVTVRLFQWACLAVMPPRLHEWHHILASIRRPRVQNIEDWRKSIYFTETDDQLERMIRSLSRGLLQVRTMSTVLDNGQEIMSTRAGAGSLDTSQGETRVLEFIHESVREFFLQGRGFSTLDPDLEVNPQAAGHLQIMKTCLEYLDIKELDDLVEARYQHLQDHDHNGEQSMDPSVDQNIPQEISDTEWDHATDELDQHSSQAERQLLQEHALTQSLNSLSSSPIGIDIDQWVVSNQVHMRERTASSSACYSEDDSSIGAKTQILKDYPALLSYATCKLFDHAKQAQAASANPEAIVRQLQAGSWSRWLLLNEAEDPFRDLQEFAETENLDTWLPYTATDTGKKRAHDHLYRKIRESSQKKSNLKKTRIIPVQISNLGRRKGEDTRRRYSNSVDSCVESFGSAGSHRSRKQERVEGEEEGEWRKEEELEERMSRLIDPNSEEVIDSDSDRAVYFH